VIYINYKVLIVTGLIIFSFINNILLGFENLRSINEETEIECFFVNVNPQISLEKPIVSHLKVIYKYTIFYLFFYDISDPSSVIKIMNYY